MNRRSLLKHATAGVGLAGSSTSLALGSAADQVGGSPSPFTVPLDGEWLVTIDPKNEGRAREWQSGRFPEAKAVRVPGVLQEAFPAYHGVAWYSREFQAPAHPHPRGRYLLRFHAVDYLADVWVNGVSVGGHEGGETPFVLDATAAVKCNAVNRVVVRVLNPSNEPIDGMVLKDTPHRNKAIPFTPGSSFNNGGLTEGVDLVLAPEVRIEDVFVRADWKTGRLRIEGALRNAGPATTAARLECSVAYGGTGQVQAVSRMQLRATPGETRFQRELIVDHQRLWDVAEPNLYQVAVRVSTDAEPAVSRTARTGFRDFRVVDGYFRLNGRRVFLRSTHTGNHCPIGQIVAPRQAPDLLRRDLLYAKSSGFNTVRFISGIAHPYQLDLCDEIGLMVYEECYAGWVLGDSPKMTERFDLSVREMILRDRNHPSVTIWGLLNETDDGPVFRHAVESLKLVRDFDDTRLVLLASGRWDRQPGIGSVSNPGGTAWEHTWGTEAPGAPAIPRDAGRKVGGFVDGVGDAHFYPNVPQTAETDQIIRTLGKGVKPVFLSEYGIGSLLDAVHEARMYEQAGAAPELEDFAIIRSMAERLEHDWKRFGMDGTYAFPEDMLRASQRLMARQRSLGFDLIRSNPQICGFNATGMLDHALTGEGFWRFWREWKPGVVDALEDGWAPLRWCLFSSPMHAYAGRPVKLEAVLANEDVLPPGEYPVRFRVMGPGGIAWERGMVARIPGGVNPPLAIPVLEEEIRLSGPAGAYRLTANMERGGAPLGRSLEFHLADANALPRLTQRVGVWGIEQKTVEWLTAHGVSAQPFEHSDTRVILVGDVSGSEDPVMWRSIVERIRQGAAAMFLSPLAFRRGKDPVGWLPLEKKGRCYRFNDWLYHKECVAKRHPVFEGVGPTGVMDWDYYGQLIPTHLFDGQETPDDVAAAAFAVGYSIPGGYASGVLAGSYRIGAGRMVLNTFRVVENLDRNPAADRQLLNLVNHASNLR